MDMDERRTQFQDLIDTCFGTSRRTAPGKRPEEKRRILEYFIEEGRDPCNQAVSLRRLWQHIKHPTGDYYTKDNSKANLQEHLRKINEKIRNYAPSHYVWFAWTSDYVLLLAYSRIAEEVCNIAPVRNDKVVKMIRQLDAADEENLEIVSIAREGQNLPSSNSADALITSLAKKGGKSPFHMYTIPVYRTMNASPCSLDQLLRDAHSTVFLVGLNLNYVATTEVLKIQIVEWLKADSSRRLDMMISSNNSTVNNFWNKSWPDFKLQLESTTQCLSEWLSGNIEQHVAKRITIKRTPAITIGMCVTDGEESFGRMALVPYMPREFTSALRPHFYIDRTVNPDLFAYYYGPYRDIYKTTLDRLWPRREGTGFKGLNDEKF